MMSDRGLLSAILAVILIVYPQLSVAQIIINEVMSNAPGRESGVGSPGDRMEFVELLNGSRSEAVDLEGWMISDGDAVDTIQKWERSEEDSIGPVTVVSGKTVIEPGQFALIFDPEYFSGGEGGWYDIGENTLVLTVENTTLGNGLSVVDPVILQNSEGDTISAFGTPWLDDGFPEDPGDGISWERVDPMLGDEVWNWEVSGDPGGSTPGKINSHSFPVNLSWIESSLVVDPIEPEVGGSVTLSGLIANRGLMDTPPFDVSLFIDLDGDGLVGDDEERDRILVSSPIRPGDSLFVSGRLKLEESGFFDLGMLAIHPEDGDTSDNLLFGEVRVGNVAARAVLNEIYYDPFEGEEEWVEIYNRMDQSLDLEGWRFSDTRKVGDMKGKDLIVQGGSFAVLVEDSVTWVTRYPDLTGSRVIQVAPFPSLGNRGDTISLVTPGGYVSDRVAYRSRWGGRKGVSLERVNPDDLAQSPANWGSSVDGRGSTPGERNSIHQDVDDKLTSFVVSPKVFSPDGDGHHDRVLIGYHLPVPRARVRLEIYDRLGNRVKVLLNQEESGSDGLVVWDGMDEGGSILPLGIYVVYLEAIESFSGYRFREKKSVVLGGYL